MRRVLAVLVVAAAATLGLAACDDDDGGDGAATTDTAGDEIGGGHSTTSRPVNTGGIEVPDVPGTFPVALPSIGFGIAVPEGWQATILSDDALERLAEANLSRPSFLDAARAVAATGAVFYAAGVDDEGRVAELKVDVQDAADTSPEAVAALAAAVAGGDGISDVTVIDDLEDGRVRVDYRFSAPSADGDATIDALGSQLFVPDGDRLWSFIVTSEDQATQDALLTVFQASIVF